MPEPTAHSVSAVARAALLSGGLHVLAMIALARFAGLGPAAALPVGDELPLIVPPWQDGEDVAVELAGPEAFELPELPETLPRPPLPEGDITTRDQIASDNPLGAPEERRRPATDRGTGAGRSAEVAWRRDDADVRTRLSDGSHIYQPQKERTARESSSWQAMRQERRTGVGDSARTRRPREELRPPEPILPVEREPDLADEEPVAEDLEPPQPLAALASGTDTTRGDGPLAAADPGARSFDAAHIGPVRENADLRAASNELHPGLIEYSAPSAIKAAGREGHGPGDAPGITQFRVNHAGNAPSVAGSRSPSPFGGLGDGSDERIYAREHLEIRQRVARAQRFPRRLAILLEQGEAIILFQVERDGRVVGEVKLEKSAGFAEFDREAVEVVRRAAPFPALPKKLLVRMRISFENPMIQ